MNLRQRLRALQTVGKLDLPFPGAGQTPLRHRLLADIAQEDVSLARLAEAHVDALAILDEAGRKPRPGALYGVWASETPGPPLQLTASHFLTGVKHFCTGAGLLDRALVTVCAPEQRLADLDLRTNAAAIAFDGSAWIAGAFAETNTATATFSNAEIGADDLVGPPGWYLDRPGFWHGALGPAACWAGGAIGLVDYARAQKHRDAHAFAHLGAMQASAWALRTYLDQTGREIDLDPLDASRALTRALTVRHLIEQACTDILRRFARAYGPRPLVFDLLASRRYREVELYIRQSHAERDLESLGRSLTKLC